jgi:hypothetical protein
LLPQIYKPRWGGKKGKAKGESGRGGPARYKEEEGGVGVPVEAKKEGSGGRNRVCEEIERRSEEEKNSGSEYFMISSSRPVYSGAGCLGRKTTSQYSDQMQSFNT